MGTAVPGNGCRVWLLGTAGDVLDHDDASFVFGDCVTDDLAVAELEAVVDEGTADDGTELERTADEGTTAEGTGLEVEVPANE